MQTSIAVFLRGLLRRLGLTRYAKAVGLFLGLSDEDALARLVDDYLRDKIRPGDVVWDVGANRGRQTRLLSDLVGRDGLVVSIEPESSNMGHLASAIWAAPNVTLVNAALSDTDGTETLAVSPTDKAGHTHFLSRKCPITSVGQSVQVFRGDTLVQQGLAPQPVFILVDVEGAEERVLAGLSATLRSATLKGLLIEVHFGALERDGRAYAPVQIERFIASLGFSPRWLDRSHLIGCRPSA